VTSHALVLVEWPERAGAHLPADHLPISLQHLPEDPARRLLYAGGHVTEPQAGRGRA
jgi:tRNA A37 threonylcarbamoyladenosine biosynthesis protein TsaE